jgi:hypothetical protein
VRGVLERLPVGVTGLSCVCACAAGYGGGRRGDGGEGKADGAVPGRGEACAESEGW